MKKVIGALVLFLGFVVGFVIPLLSFITVVIYLMSVTKTIDEYVLFVQWLLPWAQILFVIAVILFLPWMGFKMANRTPKVVNDAT